MNYLTLKLYLLSRVKKKNPTKQQFTKIHQAAVAHKGTYIDTRKTLYYAPFCRVGNIKMQT